MPGGTGDESRINLIGTRKQTNANEGSTATPQPNLAGTRSTASPFFSRENMGTQWNASLPQTRMETGPRAGLDRGLRG